MDQFTVGTGTMLLQQDWKICSHDDSFLLHKKKKKSVEYNTSISATIRRITLSEMRNRFSTSAGSRTAADLRIPRFRFGLNQVICKLRVKPRIVIIRIKKKKGYIYIYIRRCKGDVDRIRLQVHDEMDYLATWRVM